MESVQMKDECQFQSTYDPPELQTPMIDLQTFTLYSFISVLDEKVLRILQALFKTQNQQIKDPKVLVNAILNTLQYDKDKYQDVLLTVHMLRLFDRGVRNKRENEKYINWKEFIDILIADTLVQDNKSLTEYFKSYQDNQNKDQKDNQDSQFKNLQRLKGLELEQKRSMQTYIMEGQDKMLLEMVQENGEILMPIDKNMSHNEKTVLQRLTQVDKRTHKDGIQNDNIQLGVVMRDNSISFWSINDDFKYERKIESFLPNFQYQIWYLQQIKKWITTDKTNQLHIWCPTSNDPQSLKADAHTEKIIFLLEIKEIEGFISSSLDKTFVIWDAISLKPRFSVEVKSSLHTIKYSKSHAMLFGASYEQNIKIYEFPNKYECNLNKILVGHSNDSSCLKCWNLTDKKCVQTYKFDYFIEAFALISINSAQFISVSNRMHLFTILSINFQRKLTDYQFEDPYYLIRDFIGVKDLDKPQFNNHELITQEPKLQDQILDVMYCKHINKIVVVNRKDVRLMNMQDGLQEVMLSKISNSDCELTFGTLEDNILIVSDIDGRLYQIDVMKCEQHEIFPKCSSQVVMIKIDIKNQQILVCEEYQNRIRVIKLVSDYQNQLHAKKLKKDHLIRELVNCIPDGDDLQQCYASFPMNIVLISNSNKARVEVWDYDSLQRRGRLNRCDNQETILSIGAFETYNLAFILTTNGMLEIYNLQKKIDREKFIFFNQIKNELLKNTKTVSDLRDNKTMNFQKRLQTDAKNMHFFDNLTPSDVITIIPEILVPSQVLKIHSNSIAKIRPFVLQNEFLIMTLCSSNFIKINKIIDNQHTIIASFKIDKPLPLKWDIQYRPGQSQELEIQYAIKLLVQLGYRKWSEMRILKSKIQKQNLPQISTMPEKIKDYFHRQKEDNSKIKSLKYQQFLVEQKTISSQYTEEYLNTLYERQGIDFLERKMENTQGNLVKQHDCIKEFIDTRKNFTTQGIDNLKFDILGIQFHGQEGEIVCNEYYDLHDQKAEDKKVQMLKNIKPHQKKLSAEIAEQIDNYVIMNNVKESQKLNLLQKRKTISNIPIQKPTVGINLALDSHNKQDSLLEIEQEQQDEQNEIQEHWLDYAKTRTQINSQNSSPAKTGIHQKKEFKQQLKQLRNELLYHQKPIQQESEKLSHQVIQHQRSKTFMLIQKNIDSTMPFSQKNSPRKINLKSIFNKPRDFVDNQTFDIRAQELQNTQRLKSSSTKKILKVKNLKLLKTPINLVNTFQTIQNELEEGKNKLYNSSMQTYKSKQYQNVDQGLTMTLHKTKSVNELHKSITQTQDLQPQLIKESFLTQRMKSMHHEKRQQLQQEANQRFFPLTQKNVQQLDLHIKTKSTNLTQNHQTQKSFLPRNISTSRSTQQLLSFETSQMIRNNKSQQQHTQQLNTQQQSSHYLEKTHQKSMSQVSSQQQPKRTVQDVIKQFQDQSNSLYDNIRQKIESGLIDKHRPISNASTSAFSMSIRDKRF
eukprot:403340242